MVTNQDSLELKYMFKVWFKTAFNSCCTVSWLCWLELLIFVKCSDMSVDCLSTSVFVFSSSPLRNSKFVLSLTLSVSHCICHVDTSSCEKAYPFPVCFSQPSFNVGHYTCSLLNRLHVFSWRCWLDLMCVLLEVDFVQLFVLFIAFFQLFFWQHQRHNLAKKQGYCQRHNWSKKIENVTVRFFQMLPLFVARSRQWRKIRIYLN